MTRDNDSTRVTIFGDSNSSHVQKNGDSTRVTFFTEWLDPSNSQWLETRVRLIFTKSLELLMDNPHFVCTKRNKHILLQWWSRLAEIFCFACVVVLCCIWRIKCPQLRWRETWDFAFTEVSAEHNILTGTLTWFNAVFAYRDHGSGRHIVTSSLFQIPVNDSNFSNPNQKLNCKI